MCRHLRGMEIDESMGAIGMILVPTKGQISNVE